MLERQAKIITNNAQQYLNQLCRHFRHKVATQWDERSGRLEFGIGQCYLHAEADVLQICCEAEDIDKLQEIMDTIKRHFDRFAHKEACELLWSS